MRKRHIKKYVLFHCTVVNKENKNTGGLFFNVKPRKIPPKFKKLNFRYNKLGDVWENQTIIKLYKQLLIISTKYGWQTVQG